mgnify:CR=1 FL=1
MEYQNLVAEIREELLESVYLAQAADVANERIILDPGIGFGKTVEQNLELIDRLDEIRSLGYPVLLGASRKGFIGYTLNLPPNQRMEGTAAAVAIGIDRGADIIRVHDVMEMVRIAGGHSHEEFNARPRMYTNINSVSPLKHDYPMLDGAMRLARRGQPVVAASVVASAARPAPAMSEVRAGALGPAFRARIAVIEAAAVEAQEARRSCRRRAGRVSAWPGPISGPT